MADFKSILKKGNSAWKKAAKRAKEDTGGFVDIPDGRYTARLVSAKLGESNAGRAQIAFGWKIEDGEYEGKTATNYQGIESEDNLFYLGRDLTRLGYELPDDLMDLPEILKDIEKTKPLGTIQLRTKGDFQNLYIRKIFDSMEEEDEDEGEEVDETEEETDEAEEGDETEEESDEESDDEESDDADEESDEEESDEEESDEEESDEESSDDEVELSEGMRVIAETSKGREAGEVIEILEDEEKVRVKLDKGKVVKVGVDRIEVEPAEAKKKAPAKKAAAPAPAKKKAAPAPAKKTAPAKKGVAKKGKK